MSDWESELRQLPDPLTPASTTSVVMARIRAMEERSVSVSRRRVSRVRGATDWRAWGLAFGMVSAAAAYLPTLLTGSWGEYLLLPRLGGWMDWTRLSFDSAPAVLLMAAGLATYLIGMTVQIRTEVAGPQKDLE